MHTMIRTWIFCCLCLCPCLLFAHEGLRFRFLDLPASLRDVNILHVTEDRKGMIWFTTSSGLHRYDGNRLLTFDLFSKPALISNAISCLLADGQDRIWAGSPNGLTMIDLHTWKSTSWQYHPDSKENLVVKYISEGQDGTIYIISNSAVLYRVSEGRLVPALDFNVLMPGSNAQLGGLSEPVKGELWVLVNGRFVILRQQRIIRTFPAVALDDAIVERALFHESGKVFFNVANNGVYIGDMATGAVTRWKHPVNDSLTAHRKINFFRMKNGNVAIYVNKYGFVAFNPVTGQTRETDPEVMQHFTNAGMLMFPGRDEKTYFSFSKGIAVLEPANTPFHNYMGTVSSETVPYSVRCIYRHTDSTWIIGNYRDGLTLVDEKTGRTQPIAPRFIYTMLPWGKDSLLAASEGDGLLWLNISRRSLTPLQSAPAGGFASQAKYTTSLYRENDSLVWAGTYSGLFLLNIRKGHIVPLPALYNHARIMNAKVYQVLAKGPLKFIATTAGLFIYNAAAGEVYKALAGQPETGVYCLSEVNGRIWAGTNGRGILVLDEKGKLEATVNTSGGLAGNAVYSILLAGRQVVAGTDYGLSLVQTDTYAVRNYTRLDKLPSNEFNHSAALQDGDRMYFGTINGFTAFDPRQLLAADTTKAFPTLYFTAFTTSSRKGQSQDYTLPYKTMSSLEVAPGTEYFSLRFGGPDQEWRQLQYYYRLGEEGWKELGRLPEISFAGLDPGQYLVQLAARISPGSAIHPLLSMPLTVFPAWYQTWWFRTLALLLAAGAVWLIYSYRMRQMLREQQLRTKIAGDLHDEVGSSLTRIYFQADLLRMKEEHASALQKIADTSRDALTTMSDMVWSIDARFDTAADLVSRMRDYVMKLQQELELSCTFQVSGEYADRALSQMVRQNFFLIFKEAVNNAARYTSAGKINIDLHFGNRLELRVQNPCEEPVRSIGTYQGGQGLHHMQLRAGRMKGEVKTSARQGSFEVTLSVPW
ncbi:sensor histidine kinase [Chitinophaga barathri]|nr:histidine kinase [Chitinophaga barathri]